ATGAAVLALVHRRSLVASERLNMYHNSLNEKYKSHLDEPMTAPEGKLKAGRRSNRRGEASRKHVLDVALRLLASGGPEAVSVKLIAKEPDVTWGTVQYQFGDADGFWAAAILHILDTAGPR